MDGRAARGIVAIGVGGALVFGAVGCGAADAEGAPVERKSFAVVGKELVVDVDDSDVTLVPGDGDEVKVTRQVDGWAVVGGGPDPQWRMEDGKLILRTNCNGFVGDCDSRHTVEVPKGVAVTVKHDNGKVNASAFGTPLKISSDNGDVTVRGTTGDLRLSTENGEVRAEDVSAGEVNVKSDNGDVKIRMKTAAEKLEAVTDNGGVVVELPPAGAPYAVNSNADNGSRKIRLSDAEQDDSSPRKVRVESENGDVTVRLKG
ncbi:DUF4097 family beta strand repeat-containing protein [Streptomyces qinzhouensis]|uniref:DUF4097 domain-containing protein n=1 Tax=Streptomyces qinzhouensis TaxID=2599401 RepID=A0A5B8IGX9_9ACTN|nr:DUF4097 family beta strand repeat-containing protein [Streptomyces qinzhouensis]QDY76569.1 DUF4097 domain-containing protein [Streptomyces qinzhouensis]